MFSCLYGIILTPIAFLSAIIGANILTFSPDNDNYLLNTLLLVFGYLIGLFLIQMFALFSVVIAEKRGILPSDFFKTGSLARLRAFFGIGPFSLYIEILMGLFFSIVPSFLSSFLRSSLRQRVKYLLTK